MIFQIQNNLYSLTYCTWVKPPLKYTFFQINKLVSNSNNCVTMQIGRVVSHVYMARLFVVGIVKIRTSKTPFEPRSRSISADLSLCRFLSPPRKYAIERFILHAFHSSSNWRKSSNFYFIFFKKPI